MHETWAYYDSITLNAHLDVSTEDMERCTESVTLYANLETL
jgi:hypothetical protein